MPPDKKATTPAVDGAERQAPSHAKALIGKGHNLSVRRVQMAGLAKGGALGVKQGSQSAVVIRAGQAARFKKLPLVNDWAAYKPGPSDIVLVKQLAAAKPEVLAQRLDGADEEDLAHLIQLAQKVLGPTNDLSKKLQSLPMAEEIVEDGPGHTAPAASPAGPARHPTGPNRPPAPPGAASTDRHQTPGPPAVSGQAAAAASNSGPRKPTGPVVGADPPAPSADAESLALALVTLLRPIVAAAPPEAGAADLCRATAALSDVVGTPLEMLNAMELGYSGTSVDALARLAGRALMQSSSGARLPPKRAAALGAIAAFDPQRVTVWPAAMAAVAVFLRAADAVFAADGTLIGSGRKVITNDAAALALVHRLSDLL